MLVIAYRDINVHEATFTGTQCLRAIHVIYCLVHVQFAQLCAFVCVIEKMSHMYMQNYIGM